MSTENQSVNEELLSLVKKLQSELDELKKPKLKKQRKKYKKREPKKKEVAPLEEDTFLMKDATLTNKRVGFKKNLFIDNGELCKEDKEFDKKIKFRKMPRNRQAPVAIEVKCERCSKPGKIYAYGEKPYWICPRCAKG